MQNMECLAVREAADSELVVTVVGVRGLHDCLSVYTSLKTSTMSYRIRHIYQKRAHGVQKKEWTFYIFPYLHLRQGSYVFNCTLI